VTTDPRRCDGARRASGRLNRDALMEFFQLSLEAHGHSATIYVTGLLAQLAAGRAEEIVSGLPAATRILRVDLRAVELIDPTAFVRVARVLARWRDDTRGKVMIQFPERATRQRHLRTRAANQPSTIGSAVNAAISWPMSTSPG
jgi:hypothetical protein